MCVYMCVCVFALGRDVVFVVVCCLLLWLFCMCPFGADCCVMCCVVLSVVVFVCVRVLVLAGVLSFVVLL